MPEGPGEASWCEFIARAAGSPSPGSPNGVSRPVGSATGRCPMSIPAAGPPVFGFSGTTAIAEYWPRCPASRGATRRPGSASQVGQATGVEHHPGRQLTPARLTTVP